MIVLILMELKVMMHGGGIGVVGNVTGGATLRGVCNVV